MLCQYKYNISNGQKIVSNIQYETGTAMNAGKSENYLAISRSSSASKSVEIFWAEIYRGRPFLRPNLVSFNRTVPYEISKVVSDVNRNYSVILATLQITSYALGV